MIKNFFRGLNASGARYLLISGQAAVIYGAVTFSEDIDLWVSPEAENWKKFRAVLAKTGARIYKLTPELSPEFVLKGHGFHFTFPRSSGEPEWYLDVMGVVPRAGGFERAFNCKEVYRTAWGVLPVIGLRELVELKKTRRLADYPVISGLARTEHERLSRKHITAGDWRWILSNSFEAEDIIRYLKNGGARKIAGQLKRPCLPFCLKAAENPVSGGAHMPAAAREIAFEIESLRQKDRLYWQPVLDELRYLTSKKLLLNKGARPSFI
ncbi:MAG: hypothetical protein FD189_1984 [Elusimicrobia bacterium]|nr:MAG: hypothetical protein FD154_2093 [Elusimicrobiota bacterium]KAF0154274.1 MAG: hypothetical protein FD189_1984 [Elusimicrobiota bacterium]